MKTGTKIIIGAAALNLLFAAANLICANVRYKSLSAIACRFAKQLDSTGVRVLDLELPRVVWDKVLESRFHTSDLKQVLYLEGGLKDSYLKGDTLFLRNCDSKYRYNTFNIIANISALEPDLELLVLHDGDDTGYIYCNDIHEATTDDETRVR